MILFSREDLNASTDQEIFPSLLRSSVVSHKPTTSPRHPPSLEYVTTKSPGIPAGVSISI